MIFAEMEYSEEYWEFHEELKQYLSQYFDNVEHGLQSDSYLWIFIEKKQDSPRYIFLNEASSQIRSARSTRPASHQCASEKYKVNVYATPDLEKHEDFL